MADGIITTCCTGSAIAVGHINRAATLLAAANSMSDLTGGVYRRHLQMALQLLGEATTALEAEREELAHAFE